jgi:hypothetical protein
VVCSFDVTFVVQNINLVMIVLTMFTSLGRGAGNDL